MRVTKLSFWRQLGLSLMLGAMVLAPHATEAQGLFSPVRRVNDQVISTFDVEQRMLFLQALSAAAGDDLFDEALRRLTEEAVQRDYARRLNVRINRDELRDGIAEFAARAELSAEEFLSLLGEAGIERQTLEAFVETGLLWRKVVGATLPPLVAVSGADLLRVRDPAAILGSQRVLISEIFLPTDPQFAEPVAQIIELIEAARSVEEFSALAREFSLAGSRDRGGRLDWLPVENLPAQIRPIARARVGEIIGPIELGGAIAYFQLRATESRREIPAEQVFVRYARLLLPGGRSEETLARVAQIRGEVRHCAGLGPYARGLPEEFLTEREMLMRAVPGSDAVEIARLDRNEISANTLEGGNLVVLMLCERKLQFEQEPTETQVRNLIFDRRLSDMADLKLQELIADADIRDY